MRKMIKHAAMFVKKRKNEELVVTVGDRDNRKEQHTHTLAQDHCCFNNYDEECRLCLVRHLVCIEN